MISHLETRHDIIYDTIKVLDSYLILSLKYVYK